MFHSGISFIHLGELSQDLSINTPCGLPTISIGQREQYPLEVTHKAPKFGGKLRSPKLMEAAGLPDLCLQIRDGRQELPPETLKALLQLLHRTSQSSA